MLNIPISLSAIDKPPSAVQEFPRNFSAFNPSLLLAPHDDSESDAEPSMLVFFRVSNMHFCPDAEPPRASWRDSVRLQSRIQSFLAFARIGLADHALRAPAAFLTAANALFDTARCEGVIDAGGGSLGSFTGIEDPRPIWSPSRTPWLIAAAWTHDCKRLRMHLVKFEMAEATGTLTPSEELPLVVGSDFPREVRDAKNVPHVLPHPETLPIQKNWLPFVHDGELHVEYALLPHVVLRVNTTTGHAQPAVPKGVHMRRASLPYFLPLSMLEEQYGSRFSGGAPPIRISDLSAFGVRRHTGVYLGLAHIKMAKDRPHDIGTSSMVYHHMFYAFEDVPPFGVIARGTLFTLPEPGDRRPTVQFASGMVLDAPHETITVSYSTLDCGLRLTTLPLREVLADMMLIW